MQLIEITMDKPWIDIDHDVFKKMVYREIKKYYSDTDVNMDISDVYEDIEVECESMVSTDDTEGIAEDVSNIIYMLIDDLS